MKGFTALLALAIGLLLASCSIDMHMNVHEDYSGTARFKVDISSMLGFMMAMDSLSEEQMDSAILAAMEMDQEIPEEDLAVLAASGITGVKVGIEERKYFTLDYAFEDMNRAYDIFFVMDSTLTEADLAAMKAIRSFTTGPDRLVIHFTEEGMVDLMNKGMEGDSTEGGMDMSFMQAMFTINQSFAFERPVARVETNGLPIGYEGNRVYYSTNLSEYLKNFVGREAEVWFEGGKPDKRR